MEVTLDGLQVVRGGRLVLDVPALTFPAGSTTAVFGPNGSGKTTLLRAIAGLDRPFAGRVTFDGAEPARRPIALAFQRPVFVRGTVRDNLLLGLTLRRIGAAERHERVAAAARECGIEGLLDRSAHELSGGEAQRASLARVLALDAPVMLLDEPLAGIDRSARAHLLDDLPALISRASTTTILVTHDRDEAFRLADRLVLLSDGRVRASGAKRSLYDAPPDAGAAALLGHVLLEVDGEMVAAEPGGITIGRDGAGGASMTVEEIIDMGGHLLVSGRSGAARIEVRVAAGDRVPRPGERVPLSVSRPIRLPPGRVPAADVAGATLPG
jgi:ABC-type sugar transport system ATPase subunit